MHMAIEIISCHYILAHLWNACGMLNFGTIILSKKLPYSGKVWRIWRVVRDSPIQIGMYN